MPGTVIGMEIVTLSLRGPVSNITPARSIRLILPPGFCVFS
jgi:hypothetical protein